MAQSGNFEQNFLKDLIKTFLFMCLVDQEERLTLWIGGLHQNVTEDILFELFQNVNTLLFLSIFSKIIKEDILSLKIIWTGNLFRLGQFRESGYLLILLRRGRKTLHL